MSVGPRIMVERKIVSKVVKDALDAGFTVDVFNGEETVIKDSKDMAAILKEMFSVDDERLYFRKAGQRMGWVQLIYGNDGTDVIADYTATPAIEGIVAGATRMAELIDNAPELTQEQWQEIFCEGCRVAA